MEIYRRWQTLLETSVKIAYEAQLPLAHPNFSGPFPEQNSSLVSVSAGRSIGDET